MRGIDCDSTPVVADMGGRYKTVEGLLASDEEREYLSEDLDGKGIDRSDRISKTVELHDLVVNLLDGILSFLFL